MRQFFTTIKFLELEPFDEEFIELIPGIRIFESKKIAEKILTEENVQIIGIIETQYVKDCEAILYYEFEDYEDAFKDSTNLEILENILQWIDDLLKNLWLLKDNAVTCDTAFLIHESEGIYEASSLRLLYQFNTSRGKLENIKLNKKEIIEFAKYHDIVEGYFHTKNSGSLNFMLSKNFSRISRGLLFVKQAREARNLAYKVSNYCSALETVFSTDSAELSHKLSERIAYFLKDDFNKLDTFKLIKKAYNIRSKLTHGDTLDIKQIDVLDDISYEIDIIIRFCFNKILKDETLLLTFDSSNNVIDSYFENLLFG
ncbi:hypothetical protein [Flavobacterium sp. LAR06]|uniref:hypothetical protein n=1 Tax=Flavobacterium sp. LAR06 TaxID=3064897 RepID=UPI0035C1FF51